MALSRRSLLQLLAAIPLAPALAKAAVSDSLRTNIPIDSLSSSVKSIGTENLLKAQDILSLPAGLHAGSTVAITAPAGPVSLKELKDGIAVLKKYGCKVEIGKSVQNPNRHPYLSAPDEFRAEEFMGFIERKDVDCILCARGGYGVMRILPMLDFEKIRQNPKIIIGYSDITALLIAVTQISNVVTFHGPVASSVFNEFTLNYFSKTLFAPEGISAPFKNIEYFGKGLLTINEGTARGRLTGGNLAMIVSTLGTPYEIDTKDKILFLEEIEEEPYKIDRMLTQLWLAGKLQEAAGIALGVFTKCDEPKRRRSRTGSALQDVLTARIKPLKIPCVYGLPFGHVVDKLTLPLGIAAELNATAKTFTVIEPSVA
ncbi:MAG: LD-carboxypeptidase [Bacteroidota bacterium]